MNMISELRRRVSADGSATITVDEYNQLQREWITRTGAEDMVAAERERLCAAIKAADDKASEGDYMLDSDDCLTLDNTERSGAERPTGAPSSVAPNQERNNE